jgi:hypothetical protein
LAPGCDNKVILSDGLNLVYQSFSLPFWCFTASKDIALVSPIFKYVGVWSKLHVIELTFACLLYLLDTVIRPLIAT